MAGGVGRFSGRNKKSLSQPDASATPSTTAPAPTEQGNNDTLKRTHLAPPSPGTFVAFEERPTTGCSHGFNSIGMSFGEGAGDDGFSGFDNSGNFGGDFGMGDGAVGCGMEVEGGTVGDFGFGGMDGKNDCGMDQGDVASNSGLSLFRKKTAPDAASATVLVPVPEAVNEDAPQGQADPTVAPPKNDETPLEAPPDASVRAAPETELVNENQFEESFGNAEFSPMESRLDTDRDITKVPESISGEGEDEVQDDLTATSYYSVKNAVGVNDAVMEEEKFDAEKWHVSKNQGVDAGPSKVADTENTMALKAGGTMEPPKQQTSFRPMTANRVSLSPQNAANRSSNLASNQDRISPTRNALTASAEASPRVTYTANPKETSNIDSLAVKNSTSPNTNQAENSKMNVVRTHNVANPSNTDNATTLLKNGGTNAPPNDNASIEADDRSVVIPGFAPLAAEAVDALYQASIETANQFGTDASRYTEDELDASMDLNLDPLDLNMEDVQKNVHAPTMTDSTVMPSQPKGFNGNFSGAENTGLSASKPSFTVGKPGRSMAFSFAQSVQKTGNAAGSKQSNHNSFVPTTTTNVPTIAAQNSTTITPPGRGRNVKQNNDTAPFARSTMNGQEYNNAVTPDGIAPNRARPSTAVPTREMQKQPVTQGQNEFSIDRVTKGHASNYSPPPHSVANTNTTPKISNVQPQGTVNQASAKDSQWDLSIAEATCSNLSFDELLNKFLEDIQEANDLQEQGENDLLELEVDLSHTMAAALRYKGDMMDLLDDIEGAQAMADHMLAQFL